MVGIGGAWQVKRSVVERVFHQTAAVEAFARAAAAPTIRSTEHVDGAAEDGAALLGVTRHQAGCCLTVGLAQLSRAADGRLCRFGSAGRAMDFRGETVNVRKSLLTIGGVGGQWH